MPVADSQPTPLADKTNGADPAAVQLLSLFGRLPGGAEILSENAPRVTATEAVA
jgi:hypothetical protein